MPIDLNDLNGPQRRIVRDAFLAAFEELTLDVFLQDELNKPPLRTLVAATAFELMVFSLINRTKQEGWTDALIGAAERASTNLRIRNLRATLERSATSGLTAVDQAVGGLERMVREDGGFADWGLWVEKMDAIGRRICRVEYPAGISMGGGTGFLVAADFVLTNYHVVERQVAGTLDPTEIRCRFDLAAGVGEGKPVPLAAAWLVTASPYSPVDPGDQGGLPQLDQLDYALLRLGSEVGNEVAGGESRGWIALREDVGIPALESIVFIGQHPAMNPLKLATGAIRARNANETRVRYDANTERGSSGSPCLNVQLEVVALHHGGDPDYTKLVGTFNQGIPIGLIVKDLATRNVPKFWV